MTTIAWDGRTLAADQRASNNYGESFLTRKIRQCSDGRLIAAAGSCGASVAYLNWLSGDRVLPPPAFQQHADDFVDALEIMSDGQIFRHTRFAAVLLLNPFVAIGTGAAFAMGAMAAGKTAVDAVEIAWRFDANSGGPVDALMLGGAPP